MTLPGLCTIDGTRSGVESATHAPLSAESTRVSRKQQVSSAIRSSYNESNDFLENRLANIGSAIVALEYSTA